MATGRKSNRVIELENALSNLTKQLRFVEQSKEFKKVWGIYTSHIPQYTGPNWNEQLVKAEEVLNAGD